VVIERWLPTRASWTRAIVVAIILLASLPAIPLVTWFMPPERFLAYQDALGFKLSKAEVHHESLLPQPTGINRWYPLHGHRRTNAASEFLRQPASESWF